MESPDVWGPLPAFRGKKTSAAASGLASHSLLLERVHHITVPLPLSYPAQAHSILEKKARAGLKTFMHSLGKLRRCHRGGKQKSVSFDVGGVSVTVQFMELALAAAGAYVEEALWRTMQAVLTSQPGLSTATEEIVIQLEEGDASSGSIMIRVTCAFDGLLHSSRRVSRPYPVLRHVVDDSTRRRTFFSRGRLSGGSGAAAPDDSAHRRGAGPLTPQPTRRGGSSRKARRSDERKRKRDQRTEGPAATGATPDGAETLQAEGETSKDAKEKSAGDKTPGGIEASGATGGDTTGSGADGHKGFVQLSGTGARPKTKGLLLVPSNAALGQRRKTYDFPNLPEGTVSLQGCAVPEFTGALAFKLYQLEWGKAFRQLVSWLS
ncbi:hypothetical protein EAH_00008430 [Eimeria acervulina]|uniref:Uncharacterized protein n=1 Tax=Eimeria acervulina TaxID=5801 RepID=U6GEQ9_EIMAC|nr:hypothetical protein EAH_00008430 [Eimeria acervulina]CDI78751.1 hypothetical protein EAH_00008430 [Eimeria acervulina]